MVHSSVFYISERSGTPKLRGARGSLTPYLTLSTSLFIIYYCLQVLQKRLTFCAMKSLLCRVFQQKGWI